MSICFSEKKEGIVAIAGHVGCGHCHSLNNQVQDDSSGLSTVLEILKEASGISMELEDILFDGNWITAVMKNGGIGKGYARRDITPQEKKMIRKLIGKEVINTHTLVLDVFGRFYGQGISETPVALQTALANAAVNGFVVNFPQNFVHCVEDVGDNIGQIAGTVVNIDGIDVSILATVNASRGGLGPLEDLEGNSTCGAKGNVIRSLGMDHLPTLVVEAMIYSSFSDGLTENTYFVRADEEDDNPYVARAFMEAGKNLGLPVYYRKGGMKRGPGGLRKNTQMVADKIVQLGKALHDAETSFEKISIIGDLALTVSQDCGGVSFMSNELHEQIGGAGMIPRTAAVINLVTCDMYHAENPIPYMTEETVKQYVALTIETMKILGASVEEATRHITG